MRNYVELGRKLFQVEPMPEGPKRQFNPVGAVLIWSEEILSESLVPCAMNGCKENERTKAMKKFHGFRVGDTVICNGYEGKVVALCEWSLSPSGEGMVEVRVPGGVTCTSSAGLIPA